MKAIVVYESLWGNTAAIARAMAGDMGGRGGGVSLAGARARAGDVGAEGRGGCPP